MTTEELLTQIRDKLDIVLQRLDAFQESWTWLKTFLERGVTWIQSPAGEFGVVSRVTYGELLLAVLFVVLLTVMVVNIVHRTIATRSWF